MFQIYSCMVKLQNGHVLLRRVSVSHLDAFKGDTDISGHFITPQTPHNIHLC